MSGWDDLSDWIAEPFWEGLAQGRFKLPYCAACDNWFFRPELACPACLSSEWIWGDASGEGAVETYTIVHRAPVTDRDVPFVLAAVRVTEGPIMLANLIGYPDVMTVRRLRGGEAVHVRFTADAEGSAAYAFAVNEWT